MQQVCGQSLFPRDYLCAAFKHYTGWCLLSFMWLVSTHDKSMDLLLTLYISKCKTFLFVLRSALICASCILFCDRSINSFLGWLGLCIIIFTITFGNWKLRASCLVPKWCNQNLLHVHQKMHAHSLLHFSLTFLQFKKVNNIDTNGSIVIE